jgi:periplasmic copper chaperone A
MRIVSVITGSGANIMRLISLVLSGCLALAACSRANDGPAKDGPAAGTGAATSAQAVSSGSSPAAPDAVPQGPDLPAGAQPTELGFINAKIRNPQQGRPTAGYLTIENNGASSEQLLGASSPDFGRVEIHTHEKGTDGMMKMTKLDTLAIGAQSQVAFEPGGLHLMLFDAKKTFTAGDTTIITLNFSNSGAIETKFTILNEIPRTSQSGHSAH